MYITITAQKSGGAYSNSVSHFVAYLQKENEGIPELDHEHFFSQDEQNMPSDEVIRRIDQNTAKLSLKEPRFYTITISPSKSELAVLSRTSEDLKSYSRAVMKAYAKCFNREIDGRAIRPEDILYFAKVEHKRYYKGTDREVRLNQPVATQILELKHRMRAIERGALVGDTAQIKQEIARLEATAPAQLGGERIREGMAKPGGQSHIHIIVSRKDASNRVSLSPRSKYRATEVEFAGKTVKRGFDRDQFFRLSEKVFDSKFGYQRSFGERYATRNKLSKNPDQFFKALLGLPASERGAALKALGLAGAQIPRVPHATGITVKAARRIRKSLEKALSSASIQI